MICSCIIPPRLCYYFTDLESVLISSWTLLPETHKAHSARRFARTPSQDLSAQFAAEGLRSVLLDKGLLCIENARDSLLWAVHEDEDHQNAIKAIAESAVEVRIALEISRF